MTAGEVVFLSILFFLGIGYGIREYARFIAINRKKSEVFTYSPVLLLKRLFTSLLLVIISLCIALLIISVRKWQSPFLSLIFLFIVLFLIIILFIMIFLDFKEVLTQHKKDVKKYLNKK